MQLPYTKLFLVHLVLLGVIHTATSARPSYLLNKPQCTEKHFSRIESLVARAQVIGPNGRKFPESFTQLKPFCRETRRLVEEIEKFFKNCFEKSVADFARLVMYTVKANMRRFCGKGSRKLVKNYIKLGPCANKYVQPDETCLRRFTNTTSQVIAIADDRMKFPHLCCNAFELIHCFENRLTEIPCMRPYVGNILDLVRSGTQSMFDLICSEYNDQTDSCQKLGPAKPSSPNTKQYKTFTFVLVDLLASIKDADGRPDLGF